MFQFLNFVSTTPLSITPARRRAMRLCQGQFPGCFREVCSVQVGSPAWSDVVYRILLPRSTLTSRGHVVEPDRWASTSIVQNAGVADVCSDISARNCVIKKVLRQKFSCVDGKISPFCCLPERIKTHHRMGDY
ncbi:hypothetical protein HN011_001924 [Eciton burchellii]|nr:hypothetical protein HN011_001924 [Eciton burchellii]